MNPDRIYRQHRDDALARQITAKEYTTFVAMPFGERFSYRSRDVFDQVICAAAARATEKEEAARPFARPVRVDDKAGTAMVITEDIIVDILESHFFVADLTFANPGVLLEAGTALGLKPNEQIILLLQGKMEELHFDIRNNRVIRYDPDGAIEEIATAFIAAARAFEGNRQRYVENVTRNLTPDAIVFLKRYAKTQELRRSGFPGGSPTKSLNETNQLAYMQLLRELIQGRLLRIDYESTDPRPGTNLEDVFTPQATALGWAVIAEMWPHLGQDVPRAPEGPDGDAPLDKS